MKIKTEITNNISTTSLNALPRKAWAGQAPKERKYCDTNSGKIRENKEKDGRQDPTTPDEENACAPHNEATTIVRLHAEHA